MFDVRVSYFFMQISPVHESMTSCRRIGKNDVILSYSDLPIQVASQVLIKHGNVFFFILLLQIAIDLRLLTGSKLVHIYCTVLQKVLPIIFWERHASERTHIWYPGFRNQDKRATIMSSASGQVQKIEIHWQFMITSCDVNKDTWNYWLVHLHRYCCISP